MKHISHEYPEWGELFHNTPNVVKIIIPLIKSDNGSLDLSVPGVIRSMAKTKALIKDAKASNLPIDHYVQHIEGLNKWSTHMLNGDRFN